MNIPKHSDIYATGKSEVLSVDPTLTDWREGSNLDATIGGGAMLAEEVLRVFLMAMAMLFIDTAKGEDLDALALDRFGLLRTEATAAQGYVRYTRGASSGTLPIVAGDSIRGTVNGVTVVVTVNADTDLPSTASYVDVLCTCSVTGPTGNVDAGVLTELVTPVVGDTAVTVTNLERFAGGGLNEADPTTGDARFRDRLRRYFTTLAKGTIAAIEAGALGIPGVYFATVDEQFARDEDGGFVAVYVGDPDGAGNSVLADAVDADMVNHRAAGVWVQVFAADREEIAIAITITHLAGVDTTALGTAIRARVQALINALGPGMTLHMSAVVAACHAASSAVRKAVVTSPLLDATPAVVSDAIRVLPADLTIAFVEGT